MTTALLLVDIQQDYFEGGRNELFHADQAAIHAREALTLFRDKHLRSEERRVGKECRL